MTVAFIERTASEHRRMSWFVAHLMASSGFWKDKPNTQRLMENLNAPVDGQRFFKLETKEDLAEYEKKFGIKLVKDGGEPASK